MKKKTIRIRKAASRDSILYVRVKPAHITKLKAKALAHNMSLSLYVDKILDAVL
jgi:hypothetical protein